MHASPYLARPETQTSRLTRAASRTDGQPGDAVINMGDLLPPPSANNSNKKKQDTLFGPSIGVVNPGPEWTEQKPQQSEKAQLQDALTPELVRTWVEKSKEVRPYAQSYTQPHFDKPRRHRSLQRPSKLLSTSNGPPSASLQSLTMILTTLHTRSIMASNSSLTAMHLNVASPFK